MVDKVARILSFISLRLRRRSVSNTKFLTDPQKRKSNGMMSGDLAGHSSRGRSVFWTECLILYRGKCSLRNLRTSRWKWAADSRRRILPSCSCGKSHSFSMSRYVVPVTVFSAKKNGPKTRVRDMAQKTFTLGESLSCSLTTCGVSVPHVRTLWRFTFPVKWNVLSSLNVRRFTKSLSFSLWLLILQQVQAVRVHLNSPPNAPDRGLRQVLLTATSPCRSPRTSLKGDTNAIHHFLEHAWPPYAHSCRDALFLLHPFIPALNVRTTWWAFLVSCTEWSFHCSCGTKFSIKQKKSRLFPVESPWSTYVPPGGANTNSDFQAPLLPRKRQEKESIVIVVSTSGDDMLQRDCDELDYRIGVCHGTQGVHTEHL
jgi:hypothetical protein